MNLHERMTTVLVRLEWQAEQAGTGGAAWRDAADMVRAALDDEGVPAGPVR